MSPLMLAGIGAVYAMMFWVVCAPRPKIALMLIAASAPLQFDVSGGGPLKFSLAEVNLLLSLPLVLIVKRKIVAGPSFLPAMLYLCVGVLCSLTQWRASTLTALVQSANYMVIMVIVFATLARREEDYRLAWHGFLAVSVFFAIAMCIERTPNLFNINKNGIGGSLATAFVVAFALWLGEKRATLRTLYLLACLPLALGTVISLSRGAWMGAIAGVLVIFGMRRDAKMLLRTGVAIVPIIVIGWLALPNASRQYASSISRSNWNIKQRYAMADFALAQFRASPLIGGGVGLRKEYDATNLFLLMLAETGLPGVLSFGLVQLTIAWTVWRTYRRFPADSFEFTLLALAASLTVGKLLHGMVDHYWSRGSLTVAWAAVGMAARVAYNQRLERRRQLQVRSLALAPEFPAPDPFVIADQP